MPNRKKISRTNYVFTRYIAWVSLSAVVLVSISGVWAYYSMDQMIKASQDRKELALGKGLALAISDLIVTKEYAQIESDLHQIMGNEGVRSVLVADLSGNVVAFLERKNISDEVNPNFLVGTVETPNNLELTHHHDKKDHVSTLWYKVDPGIPLGWIRMESFTKFNDDLLENLRINVLLSLTVLFLALVSISLMLFYKFRQKTIKVHKELIRDNESLYDVAHFDLLTKLPNRLSLNGLAENAMQSAIASSTKLAICFLDLDGFKAVNDSYGHLLGDSLLVATSSRIKKVIRDGDTVIRLGGDEFVLLLGNIDDIHELDVLLHRILEALSSPFTLDCKKISISGSIGVTIYPNDKSSLKDLLEHADAAMYEAKKKGKNTWIYHTDASK